MLQLGLLEETAHSAVETATARVDVGLDLRVDDAEIDHRFFKQRCQQVNLWLPIASCQLPLSAIIAAALSPATACAINEKQQTVNCHVKHNSVLPYTPE